MDKKRPKSDNVWTGTEPYKGRTITLSVSERDHILQEHPTMGARFTDIYESVTDPDVVHASSSNEQCEVFFKSYAASTSIPDPYVKTIIRYPDNPEQGRIITAFIQPGVKGGIGEQLYKKNNV